MTRIFLIVLAGMLAVPVAAQTQEVVEEIAAKEFVENETPAGTPADKIVTVTADLAQSIGMWTGVRGCAEPSRAREALNAAFDKWLTQQELLHPGKKLRTYGWRPTSWWNESGTNKNGRPSCKGGFRSAPVYARFL